MQLFFAQANEAPARVIGFSERNPFLPLPFDPAIKYEPMISMSIRHPIISLKHTHIHKHIHILHISPSMSTNDKQN